MSRVNISRWQTKLRAYGEAAAREAAATIAVVAADAVADMRAETIRTGKVDLGTLRDSFAVQRSANQSSSTVTVTAAEHVVFVEGGRRPGARMPPLDIIRQWVMRHGMPASAAYPVARSISERGIKPTPIVAPAIARAQPRVLDALRSAIIRAAFLTRK